MILLQGHLLVELKVLLHKQTCEILFRSIDGLNLSQIGFGKILSLGVLALLIKATGLQV